jgi:hypothetical protein
VGHVPAAQRKAAVSHRSGSGLVYKTRVADDDDGSPAGPALPARRASAQSESEMTWWDWVDARIDHQLEAMTEAVGQVSRPVSGAGARMRRRKATGDMIIVRYADDFIVGFQHEADPGNSGTTYAHGSRSSRCHSIRTTRPA